MADDCARRLRRYKYATTSSAHRRAVAAAVVSHTSRAPEVRAVCCGRDLHGAI